MMRGATIHKGPESGNWQGNGGEVDPLLFEHLLFCGI